MPRKKIIILGGGIGGLSAAHELSKRPDEFDITIIERNNYLGGQAAEIMMKHTFAYPSVCWHTVSNRYKYFFKLMKEIIDEKGESVASHLKHISRVIYCLSDRNYMEYNKSFIVNEMFLFNSIFENIYKKKIPKKDVRSLYKMYIFARLISEERLLSYDTILWKTYIKCLSPEVRRWVLYFTSTYLDMEHNKISTYFMFRLMRSIESNVTAPEPSKFYAFDGPISVILFDPWRKQLERAGVKFLLNHEVTHIFYTTPLKTISTISVLNDNVSKIFTSDIYINAMDSKNLANLYPINNKFLQLYHNSRYTQTKILYCLPYKLQDPDTPSTGLVLPNTEWFITIRIVGELWDIEKFDYLLCGIGIWDVPGKNGKNAKNCTREELAAECWLQLTSTDHTLKIDNILPKWNILDSFKFDPEVNELTTTEPKFSNNIYTQKLRPSFIDANLLNLYHATSYAKTNTNVYNMESAVEAGVETANIICIQKDKLINSDAYYNIYFPPKITDYTVTICTKICRSIDKYLFLFTKLLKKKNQIKKN